MTLHNISVHDLTCDAMENVGAIVLGGGRGTRLYPLTAVRAKPAVPLCGRYRLVDIPLSNCIHSGIKKIVVLTQFNSHSLNRHITQTYKFDNFTEGYVEVLAAEQTEATGDWFQGTADAVRKQLLHIRDLGTEYYLILSGDQLYRMDYRALMQTHIKKGADITVAALPVDREAARGFGIMKVNPQGRIQEFVEKPKDGALLDELVTPQALFDEFELNAIGKPYLGSMGVYVFKAELLERVLAKYPEWVDFGKEVLPKSLHNLKVEAHMFGGYWEDIGTVRSYFDVSMEMTSPNPPFKFHDPQHLIYTHARALPGVQIEHAEINNSIICEGTRITRASIQNSIIGVRAIVFPEARIDNTIVLGAEKFEPETNLDSSRPRVGIGPGAQISNAIIDHNARIGRGVVIRGSKKAEDYDGDGYCIRDGIVIVLKNAVIRDNTVIAND